MYSSSQADIETMCHRPSNADFGIFFAISDHSERNEVVRFRVEQSTFASPDRMNHDKVPIFVAQVYRRFTLPIHHARRRAEQPTMKVAQEDDTVRECRKAP